MNDDSKLRPFICELRALAEATGSLPAMLEFNSVAQDILNRAVEAETRRCAEVAANSGYECSPDIGKIILQSAGLEPETKGKDDEFANAV